MPFISFKFYRKEKGRTKKKKNPLIVLLPAVAVAAAITLFVL